MNFFLDRFHQMGYITVINGGKYEQRTTTG